MKMKTTVLMVVVVVMVEENMVAAGPKIFLAMRSFCKNQEEVFKLI